MISIRGFFLKVEYFAHINKGGKNQFSTILFPHLGEDNIKY